MSQDDDGRLLLASIVGFGAGLYMFFKGFRTLREFRVVADTPEIPIRSIPMGLVHIRGQARSDETMVSPISHTLCYLSQVVVEEWHSGSEGEGEWKHVVTDLQSVKFYLEDSSGNVLVDATDAELDLPPSPKRVVRSIGTGHAPAATSPPHAGHATDMEVLQYIEQARARRLGHVLGKGISLIARHAGGLAAPSPAKEYINFLVNPTGGGAAALQEKMVHSMLAMHDPGGKVTLAALEVWKHPQGTPEFQAAFTALGMIAARTVSEDKGAAAALALAQQNPAQGLGMAALAAASAEPQSDPELERARQAALAYTRSHGSPLSGLAMTSAASGHFRVSECCLLPGETYDLTGTCAENPTRRDQYDRNIILKGTHEPTFLISSRTQKQVEAWLRKRFFLHVFGGAALAIVCLVVILWKAGLF
jgi:hypothetical protein